MTSPTPSSTDFAILLAGPITVTDRLKAQTSGRRVIAADGGIAHAHALDLTPELWLGDFDSSTPADGNGFLGLVRQGFPAAKDVTDGALGIQEARARGATSLVLVGAFGGRTDHAFAIMTAACALARQGIKVLLTSGYEEAVPLGPTPQRFDYAAGTQFSVLGFTALDGLTLTGAHWPLDAIHLPFGDSLSISNEVTTQLTATVSQGDALLLAHLAA